MIEELWMPIKGFEGRYEISNFGRVKSLERSFNLGKNSIKVVEKILKQENHYRGYKTIKFKLFGGGCKKFFIHRLVGEHFIPNPEMKDVVNHIDADKTNNHISNLEWMTFGENTRYYFHVTKKEQEANIETNDEEQETDDIVSHAIANF